jgi:hypothetical protein
MTTKNIFILVGLALAMVVILQACSKQRAQAVTYKRMANSDYQNFLINWDENKYPVLCALLQDPAQYNALFQPAAVNRAVGQIAPEADLYLNEQILVVAQVGAATANMDQIFEVEQVTERDEELTFHYRYHESKTDTSFLVKHYLALRIPRCDYKKMRFIENGKQVGELNITAGQWSIPAMTLEPNTTDAGNGK